MNGFEKSICKNCKQELHGPVCHQCGQQRMASRWTLPILAKQLANQLTNIEKGFLISSFLIDLLYNVWVYRQTFEQGWGVTIFKAVTVSVIGFITFFVLVALFSLLALALTSDLNYF